MAIKLSACSDEELKEFNEALKEITEKLNIQVVAVPIFVPEDSTRKFMVDAQLVIMKKEEVEDEPASEEEKADA